MALVPETFLRADEALRNLSRNAARQQALRTVEEARRRDVEHSGEGDEHQGRHAAADASGSGSGSGDKPGSPAGFYSPRPSRCASTGSCRMVAAAVLPYAKPQRNASRAQGGFDFFGTQTPKALGPGTTHAQDDIADVVGDEALADAKIIDLTVHDETEQMDLRDLRELRAKSS